MANKNGYVRVLVRDGVGFASLPNKTIQIKAYEYPPLIGRMILPNHVDVGDIFEPRVIIDNPEDRDLKLSLVVNTASFELLDADPSSPRPE